MDQAEWQKVLDEEFVAIAHPQVGDLALYLTIMPSGARYYLHVGEVVDFTQFAVPRVLSKLGAVSGEVLHDLRAVPYQEMQRIDFEVEFYTHRD